MTSTYAQSRIRNALKEHPDSAAQARQTVMRWALEDPKLMAELVAPHLSGIVAYAMARVEQGQGSSESALADLAGKAKGKGDKSFGLELLKNVADDNAAIFGHQAGHPTGQKPASQNHIDAINLIAEKGKTSKK